MGMSCGLRLRAEAMAVANLWATSLAIDYLGVAKVGQWMTFDTTYRRVGKTLCYAECDVAADGETTARARASFRVAAANA